MSITYIGKDPIEIYFQQYRREQTENGLDILTPRIYAFIINNWESFSYLNEKMRSNKDFIKWVYDYQQDPNYKFYRFIKDYEKSN